MTKKNSQKKKDKSEEEMPSAVLEVESPQVEELFEEENSEKKKKKKKKKGKEEGNEASEVAEPAEEAEDDQDDKKNKKSKKKVDVKKEKKGGPGKKALAAMQETLRKIKVRFYKKLFENRC